jgi:hypothetical protein
MSIGINDFVSNFQGGGARPNLYRVTINSPFITNQRKNTFMCKSASVPASAIGLADVSYMGRKIKIAGDKEFADWTASFYEDTDYSNRDSFERWVWAINAHELNTGVTNPRDYYAEIVIEQLDRDGGATIQTYKLIDAFPTEVGDITLGYAENDTVEEFSVTFAMNYWTSDSAST